MLMLVGYPILAESTSGPCAATEKRVFREIALNDDANVLVRIGAAAMSVSGSGEGEIAEEVVKVKYPNIPPFISCSSVYWRIAFGYDVRNLLPDDINGMLSRGEKPLQRSIGDGANESGALTSAPDNKGLDEEEDTVTDQMDPDIFTPDTQAASTGNEAENQLPLRDQGEDVVRHFYLALERADGFSASQIIIPEKRNRPAFRPDALSDFYGALSEPLKLVSISQQPEGGYYVRYRYRAGSKACNGDAIVQTEARENGVFISSISPVSGC
ncbi:hypothetical protein [Sandarakinorhabdus rubra]|uniref:hypothetical protein n=1 Tax=Sandarakinorhabdus rubra TaxID=2672568 RepID=UPI0013DAA132|nr:hypothetical protein [Sandarakinorhabdus rubra]